eukprot:225942-Alexandrium_andersonii.AAC.1
MQTKAPQALRVSRRLRPPPRTRRPATFARSEPWGGLFVLFGQLELRPPREGLGANMRPLATTSSGRV